MKKAALALAVASSLMISVLTLAAPATAGTPGDSNDGVRIMPLGDSITQGYNILGGYRTRLWQDLTGAGVDTDLVGSLNEGAAALGDKDHEGHSGWTIDQIDAQIGHWLFAADPHSILLQIGTNDIRLGVDPVNAPARLARLIDHIRGWKPNAQLFVAQITPMTNGTESQVQSYNAAIPGIVASRGPNVHWVNMHDAILPSDLQDGIHPTQAGFDKMGAFWASTLRSYPIALQTTPYEQSAPPIGQTISLRASNGLYVSAWQPDGNALEAIVDHVAGWEEFTVVDAGHGLIGLRSVGTGNYVSALDTAPSPLVARVNHLAGWEMFRWIDVGPHQVVLVAATNTLVVGVRTNVSQNPVRADATLAGSAETLTWAAAP